MYIYISSLTLLNSHPPFFFKCYYTYICCIYKYNLLSLYNITCMCVYVFRTDHFCMIFPKENSFSYS